MDNDATIRTPESSGQGLRILVENSEYWLRNHGDLAMMEVTLKRLSERWPNARIAVLTDTPALLRAYFPKAEAITVHDGEPWAPPAPRERLAARLGPRIVGPIAMSWLRTRTLVPQKASGAKRRLTRAWRALVGDSTPVAATTPLPTTRGSFAAVRDATLLLSLGGGYLTDADAAQTNRVLNLVDQAHRHSVPVVMVGQGLGPLQESSLRSKAARVLPPVELVALRERRRGPALLSSLGVPQSSIVVTGDDAIELAYEQRSDHIGSSIGFCLRIAGYTPISSSVSRDVGRAVCDAAREFDNCAVVPLMIAEYKSQDRKSTLPLVRGYPRVHRPPNRYAHPREIAARVADCRIMVTGAYHLAVFALSQGIPVVALSASEYYDDKFLGLADMFETGVQIVNLRDPAATAVLEAAIDRAWRSALEVREPLRTRAREQIELSRAGFDRVFDLVEGARSASP